MSTPSVKRERDWELGLDHLIHKDESDKENKSKVQAAPDQVQLVPVPSHLNVGHDYQHKPVEESPQRLASKFVRMAHTIDTRNNDAANYILAAMLIEKREGERALLVVRLCEAYINTINVDNIKRAVKMCETWLEKDTLPLQQRTELLQLQKLATTMLNPMQSSSSQSS